MKTNNILKHTLATQAAKRGAAKLAPVRPMGTSGLGTRPPAIKGR